MSKTEKEKKLETLQRIVTNYDRLTHQKQMLPDEHSRYGWHKSFNYLNPSRWNDSTQIPYVAASSLIDAYSLLPTRPDLAFNSLWAATNSSYNDLYLSQHNGSSDTLTDSRSIEFSIERITQRLGHTITLGSLPDETLDSISIKDMMQQFFNDAPDKIFHFVASYALKGIAVDMHNKIEKGLGRKEIRKILIPSTYNTFKSRFPNIHGKIEQSTGHKYFKLCNIQETTDKTDINYGITPNDSKAARALVHATGEEIKKAVTSFPATTSSFGPVFGSDKEWLTFLVFAFLYASRNTAVHGNAASRLNSLFANADTLTASTWNFLFGYLYLSLIMYCQGKIDLDDLAPHSANSRLLN